MEKLRAELYEEFINIFVTSLRVSQLQDEKKKGKRAKELAIDMQEVALQMAVLCPEYVLDSYLKWRAVASNADGNIEDVVSEFENVLRAMRRDLRTERLKDGVVKDILA